MWTSGNRCHPLPFDQDVSTLRLILNAGKAWEQGLPSQHNRFAGFILHWYYWFLTLQLQEKRRVFKI